MSYNLVLMGPHGPAYLSLVIITLFIFAIRMFFVIVSNCIEYILIRIYFKKIKSLLVNQNNTNFLKLISDLDKPGGDKRFIEEILLKSEQYSYFHFKRKFLHLIGITQDKDNRTSLSTDLLLFWTSMKSKFSKRMDTIKSTVLFSLLAVLFAVVMSLNTIAETFQLFEKDVIDFKVAFLMFNEGIFMPGVLLIIILFLTFMGYIIIKRKYYMLVNGVDEVINQILKQENCDNKKNPDTT